MVKLMVHITKAIIALIVSFVCLSCGFDVNRVSGDGNVTTKVRPLTESFNAVSASNGLDVIIQQGKEHSVIVEADENLHEHIKTEVSNGELKISADGNINNAAAKKITVIIPSIVKITSSGGAAVISRGTIESEKLALDASGGASLKLSLKAQSLVCETSGGSSIELLGSVQQLETKSSSGSHLDAKKLTAANVKADASSGASAYVYPTASLNANASSGSSIHYYGSKAKVTKKDSSGGSVVKED